MDNTGSEPRSSITLADSSLLRGTTAAVLLACFGRRLRSTAGGIGTVAVAEDEFSKSFVVPQLDIFFSHSWHALWYLKYFTVLFYFNSVPAVVVSLSFAILGCGINFLMPSDYERRQYEIFAVGSVGFFLCLFCWQHFLVAAGLSVKSLFLDKVCIHQTDMEKKAQGIKSIGAILGRSDMVLVAWDPSYFTRLWCTFELAAYKYAKPEAPVVVLPVTIGGFIFALTVMQFIAQITVALLKRWFKIFNEDKLGAFMLVYFAQSIFCSASFRIYTKELQRLDYQLRNFSVRNAKCFCCSVDHILNGNKLPCDRKLVEYSIAHWHGRDELEVGLKKFDGLIRGTFRDDIQLAFRGSRVPYTFVVSTTIWAGLYQIDRLSVKGWEYSTYEKWATVFNSTFLLYPLNIAILINVCQKLFQQSLSELKEEDHHQEENASFKEVIRKRVVDMLLACISTASVFGMVKFAHWAMIVTRRDYGWDLPGVVFVMIEASIVWVLYRRSKQHQEPSRLLRSHSRRLSLESIFSPQRITESLHVESFRAFRSHWGGRSRTQSTPLCETELRNYKKDQEDGSSSSGSGDEESLDEGRRGSTDSRSADTRGAAPSERDIIKPEDLISY